MGPVGATNADEAPPDSTSPTSTPQLKGRGSHTPERKCILSGAHGERDNLIRLALSPEGEVLPDVRAKAPGRGAWIGVDRQTLEAARTKGKLRGALARAFKGAPLSIPEDLGERSTGSASKRGRGPFSPAPNASRMRRARARSISSFTPQMRERTATASWTRPGGSAKAGPKVW